MLIVPGRIMLIATCALLGYRADAAESTAVSQCSGGQRSIVIENILTLGTQLSLGRLCGLQEATLHQLKYQTLSRNAECLQAMQIKGTEIQDALEAGRPLAHDAYKHAASKSVLCEQIRLAVQ